MSAACLAFLPFNLPRARLFMGDVGSLLIGFPFAALVVTTSSDLSTLIRSVHYVSAGATVKGCHRPTGAICIRFWSMNCVFRTGVSLLYGSLQAFVGGLMILAWHLGLVWQLLLMGAVCCGFWVLMVRIRRMAGQGGWL